MTVTTRNLIVVIVWLFAALLISVLGARASGLKFTGMMQDEDIHPAILALRERANEEVSFIRILAQPGHRYHAYLSEDGENWRKGASMPWFKEETEIFYTMSGRLRNKYETLLVRIIAEE